VVFRFEAKLAATRAVGSGFLASPSAATAGPATPAGCLPPANPLEFPPGKPPTFPFFHPGAPAPEPVL